MSRRCSFCGECGHYRSTCSLRLESLVLEENVEINEDLTEELGTLQELLEEFNDSPAASSMDPNDSPNVDVVLIPVLPIAPGSTEMASAPGSTEMAVDIFDPGNNNHALTLNIKLDEKKIKKKPSEPCTSCPICMDNFTTQPKTELECRHAYCTKCIMTNLEHGNLVCPMCRDVIMGPSKKVVELNKVIDTQHTELCEQDDRLNIYEAKFRSYESEIKYHKKNEQKLNSELTSIMNDLEMVHIDEVKSFIQTINLEYNKYKHTQLQSVNSSIIVPKLSELICSLFTSKSYNPTSIPIYKDMKQIIIPPESCVKILCGRYRNYMARMIWIPDYNVHAPSNKYNGKYVVRVYMGLGKPKLGKGIFDRSYTKDITFHITEKDSVFYRGTSLYAGDEEESLICPQMLLRIPNDVVTYKIKGNSTKLDPEIKKILNKGHMNIILQRQP